MAQPGQDAIQQLHSNPWTRCVSQPLYVYLFNLFIFAQFADRYIALCLDKDLQQCPGLEPHNN
jgi:hypothetical protein